MIDLQKLIIERITLINQIPTTINIIINKQIIKSIQSQTQVNRYVLNYISLIKTKQRSRIKQQGLLLEEIKGLRFFNKNIIEEVYNVSRSAFYLYNQDLQHLVSNQYHISEKLRKLYKIFFEKQQTRISAKQITKILQNQIIQLTPFILIGWTCQWSRNLLNEKIQQTINAQYIRHEQQMKTLSNACIKLFSDAAIKRYIPSNQTQIAVSTCNIKNSQKSLFLTNKQSVYGLFLDELSQYYKSFPLQLDFSFIKSMRKIHYKGNLFQNQDNLQKAIDILIQSKNKNIKDSQEQYKMSCVNYLIKNPNSLSKNWLQKQSSRNSPDNRTKKRKWKKMITKIYGLQRIKSQSKQQNYKPLNENSRQSFLLHPKTNEISFQASKQIIKFIKQKDKKQVDLPQINKKSNSNLYNRSKAVSNYSVHKSLVSNYEKGLLKSQHIIPKNFQLKNPSISPISHINHLQRILKNNSYLQSSNKKNQQLGLLVRRESEQFRQNRKLMLQLLRQKNKNFIFDQ